MVSTTGTTVSIIPEWRFPNSGLQGHGGRNIHQPYFTDSNSLFLFSSGFHLIQMPVVSDDVNNRINLIVAKYYDIKGIAKVE